MGKGVPVLVEQCTPPSQGILLMREHQWTSLFFLYILPESVQSSEPLILFRPLEIYELWYGVRSYTTIYLSSSNHCRFTTSIPACISGGYHYTPHRSHSLSAFVLVFRTPRGLYFNFTRIRSYFSYCSTREWEGGDFRSSGNNLRYDGHRNSRVCSVSSPHIHRRDRCRYPGLFYFCHNNHCGPHGD